MKLGPGSILTRVNSDKCHKKITCIWQVALFLESLHISDFCCIMVVLVVQFNAVYHWALFSVLCMTYKHTNQVQQADQLLVFNDFIDNSHKTTAAPQNSGDWNLYRNRLRNRLWDKYFHQHSLFLKHYNNLCLNLRNSFFCILAWNRSADLMAHVVFGSNTNIEAKTLGWGGGGGTHKKT